MPAAPSVDPFFLLPSTDGLGDRRYLALPDLTSPTLLVDLSSRRGSLSALLRWGEVRGPRDAVRLGALAVGVLLGRLPAGAPVLSIPGGRRALPKMLDELVSHGIGLPEWWCVALTRGSSLRRGVFFVRLSGGQRVVVKFAHQRGQTGKFDREERGLALVEAAGGVIASCAPRPLARFDVDGYPVSVQTACAGQDLGHLLRGPLPRRVKVLALGRVVSWLTDVARSTRQVRSGLEPASVFVHGDLADGNVMVTMRSVAIVDWERARADGEPLWDLLYFAANTLPLLDGVGGLEPTLDYLLSLFRGEQGRSSALLFHWVQTHVDALGLEPAAVGGIVARCWRAHADRVDLVSEEAAAERRAWPLMESLSTSWSADPELGETWRAWLNQ